MAWGFCLPALLAKDAPATSQPEQTPSCPTYLPSLSKSNFTRLPMSRECFSWNSFSMSELAKSTPYCYQNTIFAVSQVKVYGIVEAKLFSRLSAKAGSHVKTCHQSLSECLHVFADNVIHGSPGLQLSLNCPLSCPGSFWLVAAWVVFIYFSWVHIPSALYIFPPHCTYSLRTEKARTALLPPAMLLCSLCQAGTLLGMRSTIFHSSAFSHISLLDATKFFGCLRICNGISDVA